MYHYLNFLYLKYILGAYNIWSFFLMIIFNILDFILNKDE